MRRENKAEQATKDTVGKFGVTRTVVLVVLSKGRNMLKECFRITVHITFSLDALDMVAESITNGYLKVDNLIIYTFPNSSTRYRLWLRVISYYEMKR